MSYHSITDREKKKEEERIEKERMRRLMVSANLKYNVVVVVLHQGLIVLRLTPAEDLAQCTPCNHTPLTLAWRISSLCVSPFSILSMDHQVFLGIWLWLSLSFNLLITSLG